MQTSHNLKKFAGALALLLAMTSWAFGQGLTTSAISGFVTDTQGRPLAGAEVVALHEPSHTRSQTTTRDNGQFTLTGLRPGGPYTVTVTAANLPPVTRADINLDVGSEESLTFKVGAGEVVQLAAVTVQADRGTIFDADKISMGSSFDSRDVEQLPSIRRNVQDIAQMDSRVTVMNLSNNGEMSAQGQNYRYNSFLVDNVQTNDPFGLNSNGFASLRSPIPFEAIQGVSVELNSYDVRRSGYTGALVNAVIKSGTNQFHGSAAAEYTDQNLRAKNPVTQVREAFRERTLTETLSGPILKDRLFFFVAFDDFRRHTPPPTSNVALDPTQVAQIVARAKTFNYEPGNFTGAENLSTQRVFISKVDWNITNDHRLSVTYRRLRGGEPAFSFFSGTVGTSFSNYWHDTKRQNDSYTAQLFSNWSPNLRTEATFSYTKYDGTAHNRGTPFPQVFIQGLTAVRLADNTTIQTATVDLGSDAVYQQNILKTQTTNGIFSAEYSRGDHTIIGGTDLQRTRIEDDFIQNAIGSYTFRSLADWLNGVNGSFTQTGIAPGKTAQDAFGNFTYNTVGVYLEDIWKPSSRLIVTAGLRADVPYVGKKPTAIPTTSTYSESSFQNAFGMASTGTNDGNYTWGPRAGFSYYLDDEHATRIRAGAGLFQGTNPAVWLSNAYQNRGVTNSVSLTNVTFNPNPNTATSAPPTAAINLTDPSFHSPAVWKENVALDRKLGFLNLELTLEAGFLQNKYAVYLKDLNLKPIGTMPDGRTRYAGPIVASSTGNGRGSNSNGYSSTANYLTPGFADVFELTNTSKGGGNDQTIRVGRPMKKDNWSASIAWTHSNYRDVSPMTATGNAISFYNTRAIYNPNENATGTSNYNLEDRIVGHLTYRFTYFKKAPTTITALWQSRSGRPYTWVFAGDANGDGFTFNDRFYVPSGPTDPRVRWNSATERDNFFAFVNSSALSKYMGNVVPRNSEHSNRVQTMDLKVTQTLPLFRGLNAELFGTLFNVGNLLNRKWGLVNEMPFSYKRGVAGATYDAANSQYVYTFTPTTLDPVPTQADGVSTNSRWQIQGGMRIRF